MKPNRILHAVLLCAALCVALGAGCQTFQSTSGKILATSAATVDSAMQGWATHVVLNKPPAETEAKVKAAYGKYQLAMRAAESAWIAAVQSGDKTAWEQAAASLSAAQAELLALIASFERKPL